MVDINIIKKYYLNQLNKEQKSDAETMISNLNKELLDNNSSDDLNKFLGNFNANDNDNVDNPLISYILKMRQDESGSSLTHGYKEIYFNEIIQNANDITKGDEIKIDIKCLNEGSSDDKRTFVMSFEYKDKGFEVENIIGFFDTEIHSKSKKMDTTGKHGVGIKSLFYFIDILEIESNINVSIKLNPSIENIDESNENCEILKPVIEVKKNNSRNNDTTKLTIKFSDKDKRLNQNGYNVDKLVNFIDACKNNKMDNIKNYFYELSQEKLIFDVRNLLFTDKNKGKENGIKTMKFSYDGNEEFSIKREDKKEFKLNISQNSKNADVEAEKKKIKNVKCSISKLSFIKNDSIPYSLDYMLFTEEFNDEKEQNFTFAIPLNQDQDPTGTRYYETYFLPDENSNNLYVNNILINSKFSNVTRTKLTDGDDNKHNGIIEYIKNNFVDIIRIFTSENGRKNLDEYECTNVDSCSIKEKISRWFHNALLENNNFVDLMYNEDINNKYLLKAKNNEKYDGKYIAYRLEDNEEYKKRYIGQTFATGDLNEYVEKNIINKDSFNITDSENIIDEVKKVYYEVFNSASDKDDNYKLKSILNLAGNFKELLFYRVTNKFMTDEKKFLTDEDIDNYNEGQWEESKNENEVNIFLSLVGRYKLSKNVSANGEIVGASFNEYLFNNLQVNTTSALNVCPKLIRNKQNELYGKEYNELKNKLLNLLVNKNNGGIIEFTGSKHHSANRDCYYGIDDKEFNNLGDIRTNVDFGKEESNLLLSKLLNENNNFDIRFFNNFPDNTYLVKDFPGWGELTNVYRYRKTNVSIVSNFINISFLKNLIAENMQDLRLYLDFLVNCNNDNWQKFCSVSIKCDKFNVDENNLKELFAILYDDKYKKFIIEGAAQYSINLNFIFNDKINSNLLPDDYFNFIKNLTSKEIYVIEVNSINKQRSEIMYFKDGIIRIKDDKLCGEVGKYNTNGKSDKIIIVHNGNRNNDYQDAVNKVINEIFNNKEIVSQISAYVSQNMCFTIQGDQYDNIKDSDLGIINKFYCKLGASDNNFNNLPISAYKLLMMGRGIFDGKCGMCGKKIFEKKDDINNAELLITECEGGFIYNIVCKECKEILEKCHKNTKATENNNEITIEYHLEVSNGWQKKDVVKKICVPNKLFEFMCKKYE